MKISVIWSSPNRDGLTHSATSQFIKGLENYGADVNVIQLNSKRIEHCLACKDGWGN